MYYKSFSGYLKDKYNEKVRRISLNAGFTCPHRDRANETSQGCIFCNEEGFSVYADKEISLDIQIRTSIDIAGKKRGIKKFIAYFQNATNTNASVDKLKETYDIIRNYPEIVALYISTRPDCIDKERLDLIESYAGDYEVWIEYGVQTIHNKSLEYVNRGHDFSDSVRAIEMTAERNIKVGAHIILGIPGETHQDMMETAKQIARMPVSGVKLHVLHILKYTRLARIYENEGVPLMDKDSYVKTACDFLQHLNPETVIFRLVSDANRDLLIAPEWINNKLEVINNINQEFKQRGTFQGCQYRENKRVKP